MPGIKASRRLLNRREALPFSGIRHRVCLQPFRKLSLAFVGHDRGLCPRTEMHPYWVSRYSRAFPEANVTAVRVIH